MMEVVCHISDKLRVIQDRVTRMLIVVGEEVDGHHWLLIYRSMETAASLHISNQLSTDKQLEHPSSKALTFYLFLVLVVLVNFTTRRVRFESAPNKRCFSY